MVSEGDRRRQDDDATGELLRRLLDDEAGHLSYEQLEALLDGGVAEEELATARAHVSGCDACRSDLRHLRAIAAQVHRSKVDEPAQQAPATAERRRSSGAWLASMFTWPMHLSRPAQGLAAIAVVLAAGAGWLTIELRQERRAASERERVHEAERQGAEADIARLSRVLQERAAAPASTPPQQLPPGSVVAFALAPGVFRAADVRRLELPAGATAVRFTLMTDLEPRAPRFQVVLRLATGAEVWRTSWSSVDGQADTGIDVVIPAAFLGPGQYILEWSAEQAPGQFEPLDDYAFAIAPRP